ncbi:MAG: hypothetical protein KTR31_23550 [Myxococcales bacterium]|nr:hypothetical protein [Myxococcales bacterium]
MSKSLQVILVGMGAAIAVASMYLALPLDGTTRALGTDPAAANVALSALPPTSLPGLGREVIDPVPAATRAIGAADEGGETWTERHAAAASDAWTATEQAVQSLASEQGWSDVEQDSVLTALRWRHDQLEAHRSAMLSGALAPAEGRRAMADAARAARNTVEASVGAERAAALRGALTRSSLGAGL